MVLFRLLIQITRAYQGVKPLGFPMIGVYCLNAFCQWRGSEDYQCGCRISANFEVEQLTTCLHNESLEVIYQILQLLFEVV